MKEIIIEFLKWAKYQPDVFFVFDNPEEAVNQFIKERNNEDTD